MFSNLITKKLENFTQILIGMAHQILNGSPAC